jgi:hypothetical protein
LLRTAATHERSRNLRSVSALRVSIGYRKSLVLAVRGTRAVIPVKRHRRHHPAVGMASTMRTGSKRRGYVRCVGSMILGGEGDEVWLQSRVSRDAPALLP